MNLFTTPLFVEGILPFILVFVLVFAVLQKSEALGDGVKKVDSLVALAIALILVSMPVARGYIVSLIPWLALALVIILIYLLIYGFVGSDKEKGIDLPDWIKNFVLIGGFIFVVVLVLVVTGSFDTVKGWFSPNGMVLPNLIIIIIISLAIWAVLGGSGESSGKKGG